MRFGEIQYNYDAAGCTNQSRRSAVSSYTKMQYVYFQNPDLDLIGKSQTATDDLN